MKILLLGKNGQVGWELSRSLQTLGEVIATASTDLNVADAAALSARVRTLQPDVIVNAAAYTAVDKAESEPDLAQAINAEAPAVLAREAVELGALLVHYSTDYVFDGSGNTPRNEQAVTGPLSVYGVTKLAGEQAIAASACRHLIFRTSWVYATRGGNFAKTMLRLASERDQLKVVADQFGAPTGADLIADVTAQAIRRTLSEPALQGLYHLVAAGETTWFDYARYVIEWARTRGLPIKVAPDQIHAIATTEFPVPAKRPLNSRLDTRKLQSAFDVHLPAWQWGVERMLMEVTGQG
ncbi:MAG TPA: dTDP-4-dehydrorhamnose reductase [Aquabacterium sp.]|nr:dTDP-4-dehydrorhamnose reductase [Aquabacterium sp.]